MNNIILIGFMGCGKTSTGVRLSYRMQQVLEDTDRLIERREKRSISQIFEEDGEAAFRQMETDCLKELLESDIPRILSVGGGLAITAQNQPLLRRLGTVIHLRALPETIFERLKNDDTRPLLQTENPKQRIEELMKQRLPIYDSLADITIDTDNMTSEEIAEEIVRCIGADNQ